MRLVLALGAALLASLTGGEAEAQTPIDSAALEKSRVLMDKIGMADVFRKVADAEVKRLQRELEAANPGKADQVAKLMPVVAAEFDKEAPRFFEFGGMLYASHFTTDELSQMTLFYDSAAGKKLVKELPTLETEMQVLASSFPAQLARGVLPKLGPELEKRDLKLGP